MDGMMQLARTHTLPSPGPIDPARDALFLDFDGTLAEIAPTPDDARLSEAMEAALHQVRERLGGRLAIISGRSVAVLERLVPVPGLALAGVHGLEIRHGDGRLDRPSPSPALAVARQRLEALAAREPGLLIEDKQLSVAVHYRAAPGLAPIAHARARWLAEQLGLSIQTGKMVIELRQPGSDKGMAIGRLLATPPFAGFRPLFVGDDDTDEAAFAEAGAQGGAGIRVGPPAPGTAASHALPDVAAVQQWLERAA